MAHGRDHLDVFGSELDSPNVECSGLSLQASWILLESDGRTMVLVLERVNKQNIYIYTLFMDKGPSVGPLKWISATGS